MGKRREPRKEVKVAVRIFGTDRNGQIFSEKACTADVSRHGAKLTGVQAQPNVDEIIGLTYNQNKGHFRVKWVGEAGSPRAGQLGLLNLTPEKPFWDFPLPDPTPDAAQHAHDRRASPRFKSVNSAEVYPNSQAAPIRARTADLSLGGCFVEMSNPLAKGAHLRIALWLKESKIWAQGKVITSTPGFGIGVQFMEMSDADRNVLRQFLPSMRRL